MSKYLEIKSQDESDKLKIIESTVRLRGNNDFKLLMERVVNPTISAAADMTSMNLNHDDVSLPVYQGIARGLQEFKDFVTGATSDRQAKVIDVTRSRAST